MLFQTTKPDLKEVILAGFGNVYIRFLYGLFFLFDCEKGWSLIYIPQSFYFFCFFRSCFYWLHSIWSCLAIYVSFIFVTSLIACNIYSFMPFAWEKSHTFSFLWKYLLFQFLQFSFSIYWFNTFEPGFLDMSGMLDEWGFFNTEKVPNI